jgi:hypothetical protein
VQTFAPFLFSHIPVMVQQTNDPMMESSTNHYKSINKKLAQALLE